MLQYYTVVKAFLVELEAAPTDGVLFDDEDDAGEGRGELPDGPGHTLSVHLQALLPPGGTLDDPHQPANQRFI